MPCVSHREAVCVISTIVEAAAASLTANEFQRRLDAVHESVLCLSPVTFSRTDHPRSNVKLLRVETGTSHSTSKLQGLAVLGFQRFDKMVQMAAMDAHIRESGTGGAVWGRRRRTTIPTCAAAIIMSIARGTPIM
jgi:hypothetical protein